VSIHWLWYTFAGAGFTIIKKERNTKMANCDSCVYNVYDDDDECYYCEVDMDEDDAARIMQGHYKECPYYQNDDEYAVVRHQM
jgi:uncharacterized paraquat-inducible protein A